MKPRTNLLTPSQREYILSELNALRYDRYNNKPKDAPEPASVREARRKCGVLQRIISSYERKRDLRITRLIKERDRDIAAVRKYVNFGTPEQALTVLEALQRIAGVK
jgi:hypothetical protein